MKKLVLALCLLAHAGYPQMPPLDSLRREWSYLQNQPSTYGFDTLRFQTLKALMRIYTDKNIDSSLHFNSLLTALCRRPTLHKELIYAYQYAGYIHQLKGDYYSGIQVNYKALALAEKLKAYRREAASLQGLAHAYMSLREYDKATKLCQKGLRVLRHHPDSYVQVSILNTLGAVYRDQGRLTEALNVNRQLYKLARAQHHPWYEAQGLHAIGWIHKEMGNTPEALAYFNEALLVCRRVGSVDLEGSILLHIADVYVTRQNWSQALAICQSARQIALKIKNSSLVAEADEKLYQIFKQTGRLAKALKAYEDFVLLRDSLTIERNQQRIEMLQAQYDNVQKTNALQQERMNRLAAVNQNQQLAQVRNGLFLGMMAIVVVATLLLWNNRRLQAKNRKIDYQRNLLEMARIELATMNKTLELRVEERTAELSRANRELIRKNEEIKAALFKGQTIERKRVAIELHDNLSSLLSAVNMSIQAINPQHLSGSEQAVYQNVKHLIQSAYTEVRNISHNILPAELEREGLVATLGALLSRLNQSSLIRFSMNTVDLNERLPVEIEFNVYSIILELLNNAIKHAQATVVVINLVGSNTGIEVTVTDDGVGISQPQHKQGIGLQNVQTRLESLGGTLETPLLSEKGTRIHIKIPIDSVRADGKAYIL